MEKAYEYREKAASKYNLNKMMSNKVFNIFSAHFNPFLFIGLVKNAFNIACQDEQTYVKWLIALKFTAQGKCRLS